MAILIKREKRGTDKTTRNDYYDTGNETRVEMGMGIEAERKDIGSQGLKIAQMFEVVKGAFRL